MSMKMTMAEFVGLEPCPFCGGEANVIDHHNDDGSVSVGCNNDTCLGFSGLGWLYKTEAEAIAAWNSRAERTCENIDKHPDYRFKCSECNCVLYYEDLDGEPWVFVDGVASVPNYCPICGARRVGE